METLPNSAGRDFCVLSTDPHLGGPLLDSRVPPLPSSSPASPSQPPHFLFSGGLLGDYTLAFANPFLLSAGAAPSCNLPCHAAPNGISMSPGSTVLSLLLPCTAITPVHPGHLVHSHMDGGPPCPMCISTHTPALPSQAVPYCLPFLPSSPLGRRPTVCCTVAPLCLPGHGAARQRKGSSKRWERLVCPTQCPPLMPHFCCHCHSQLHTITSSFASISPPAHLWQRCSHQGVGQHPPLRRCHPTPPWHRGFRSTPSVPKESGSLPKGHLVPPRCHRCTHGCSRWCLRASSSSLQVASCRKALAFIILVAPRPLASGQAACGWLLSGCT
eukprot:GGOE01011250.1.p1 GENE.GGOE01011250.1~~GGOE01011250.1.p1  ORF type:complete len:357 (-),score=-6.12 GGOE01011250.1:346-1329(-)